MSLWCFVAQLLALRGINGASSHSQEFKPVTYKCQKQGSYLELVYNGRDSNKRFLCQMERPNQELKTVYHWTFLSSPDLPQKTDLIIAETHYRLFWLFICRSNYTPNSWVVLSVYNTLTLYKKEWLLWYIIQGSTKSGAT